MPLPQPASVRDRTPEFVMLCERLQRQLGAANGASSNGISSHKSSQLDRGQQIQNHSEFARKAAEIGHGIHKTSMKLQKLAQLAKRTSMFDDPAQEVDELTGLVKQDIQALNNNIAELQRISARNKEDSKQSHDHSHTVVDSLRTRLKDATQQFKDVLTVRTDNLKHHKERRQLFSSTDAEASVPLLRPQSQLHQAGNSSMGSDATSQAMVPSFMQSQQQLQVAAPQETYMSSRAEALRNVETTIVELGTIFNKLSEMVAQQGDMAVRIDRDVEDTLTNVTSAQQHILKYFNEVSSNRWLILKVFGVLLVFIVFFIMFIA